MGTAGSEYVSMGGRDAEMTFGIGTADYSALYDGDNLRTIALGPNAAADDIGLRHLPSDAAADLTLTDLLTDETYIITSLGTSTGLAGDGVADGITGASSAAGTLTVGTEFTMTGDLDLAALVQI